LAIESYKVAEYHKTSPPLLELDTAKLRHTKIQLKHLKMQKKSDFLPPFSFPFQKLYFKYQKNQYTPLLKKNKENFRLLHYLIKEQSRLVASTMLSFVLIISSIISFGALWIISLMFAGFLPERS
jgi:hypothetical protein